MVICTEWSAQGFGFFQAEVDAPMVVQLPRLAQGDVGAGGGVLAVIGFAQAGVGFVAVPEVGFQADGAVAGVLSAVMISMGGTERIVNEKLAAAKAWMREHHISKPEQAKALNYFRHVYRSHVMYQEADILNTVRILIFLHCTRGDFAV